MASQAESRSLCFVSWNTCGIKNTRKSPQKLIKCLNNLNKLQADVVFIQETHVGSKCYQIFKKTEQENWNVFFTVHSPKSKGVAILIKKDIEFDYICHDEDCSGGYIVLFCHLYGELYTLVNVYNHKADRFFLGRLKEYLSETAEGVLVVGGDFNTILDPHLDRKPPASKHSPFRDILEDFTISLNLRDTWSYLHPTEEGFTRHQKKSHSRLDMFFLPEDRMGRVSKIDVACDRAEIQAISDHYPLVLKLRFEEQTEKKIPNVARRLEKLNYIPDSRPGKISGAEILSVIKSLTDSEERRLDTLDVKYYKTYQCPLTETLKLDYNLMIKNKKVPELFKKSYCSEDKHIFNVDYLIFSQILAKRFSFTPIFKGKIETDLNITHILSFETGKQEITWSFLLEILKMPTLIPSDPKLDSILDCILPKGQHSGERRCLLPGCPLTNTILNLALKYLKDEVLTLKCVAARSVRKKHKKHKCNVCKTVMSMATVCYQRRILLIRQPEEVERKVSDFKEKSALKININILSQTIPIQRTAQYTERLLL